MRETTRQPQKFAPTSRTSSDLLRARRLVDQPAMRGSASSHRPFRQSNRAYIWGRRVDRLEVGEANLELVFLAGFDVNEADALLCSGRELPCESRMSSARHTSQDKASRTHKEETGRLVFPVLDDELAVQVEVRLTRDAETEFPLRTEGSAQVELRCCEK